MLSEAVYLDLVTEDATRGFVVRLCRHPQEGYAWLWGHVFLDGKVYAFTQHDVPCSAAITPVETDAVVYRSEGGWSSLPVARPGNLGALRVANVQGVYDVHENRHAPHGPGAIALGIEATFTPAARAVSNRAGRNEVLGEVTARITMGRHAFALNGRGQFHEQVQTDPRFTTPFSYGTVRGAKCGLIFIRGTAGARGHWLEAERVVAVDRCELSPPGSVRAIVLHGEDRIREGVLHSRYDYSIPVGEHIRPGTLVTGTIDGEAVSGCLNDFLVDRLRYDRI